jgi:formamidopyrimidine-DNA glycosylase
MPELPDIEVYLSSLRTRVVDHELRKIRVASPFLLRTADPPIRAAEGRRVTGLRRIGKRVVLALDGDHFLVIHLMIAGRFRWKEDPGAPIPGKVGLAAFDFDHGTLILTEASPKKRASLHLVRGEAALAALDPGGIEPLGITLDAFRTALTAESHTLKRVLTDPHVFSGIGNAYSDEILHHARLSPIKLSIKLTDDEIARLHASIQHVLTLWTERLRKEVGAGFPEKVTAFRPEMAVHGKHKQPCPDCGSPVQRIVHGEHETNYCPTCQTGGKLLADRALSRLLKSDWPKTLEAMEAMKRERRQ